MLSNKKSYLSYRKKDHRLIAIILYALGILLLAFVDQLTKLWAVTYLEKVGSVPVLGDYLRFTYVTNKGAAYNILQGQTVFLIAVPAVLSAVCIGIIVSRRLHSVLGDISLMLIAAGGVGNLIDRITRGYVVDFIDFNIIHFAIFNFADSCVMIGVVLFIIFVLLREKKAGEKIQE